MVIKVNTNKLYDPEVENVYLKVSKALSRSNRCMVITGAGISCSAGIPDFRSKNGLFSILKQRNSTIVKGQDLFDANLFKDAVSTSIFYQFMGEFKDMIAQCKFTKTHGFIKRLHDFNKLLRCYTQNIDDLELGLTLNTDLKQDPQNTQVVQLHGSMSKVICTLAPHTHQFDFSEEYVEGFKLGEPPICPSCSELSKDRTLRGKRDIPQGTLRPDIVLYNEHHPQGELIGNLQAKDLKRRPDFLLIMGTSLKIPGCKRLVKEAAKIVHSFKNGLVVFVNLSDVSSSEWDDVVDYHFQCPTDNWVNKIEPLFLSYCNTKSIMRTASVNLQRTRSFSSFGMDNSNLSSETSSCTENESTGFNIKYHSPTINSRFISPKTGLIKANSAMAGRLKSVRFDKYVLNANEEYEFKDDELFDLDLEEVLNEDYNSLPKTNSIIIKNRKSTKFKFDPTPTKIKKRVNSIKNSKRVEALQDIIENKEMDNIGYSIRKRVKETKSEMKDVKNSKKTIQVKRKLNNKVGNKSNIKSKSKTKLKKEVINTNQQNDKVNEIDVANIMSELDIVPRYNLRSRIQKEIKALQQLEEGMEIQID